MKQAISMGLAVATLAAVVGFRTTQSDPVVAAIIDEGKNRSQVMATLTDLTNRFGPRLTSSTNLDRANRWAVDQFRKYGCTNVRLEQWGEFPVGFDRGKNSFGRMISPERLEFEFTSPSWTEGTNGPVRGRAIAAPKSMDELSALGSRIRGAWVLYSAQPPRQRPGQPPAELTPEQKAQAELEAAIESAGIAGRVFASRNELVLTSGNWRIDPANLPKGRRVTVRKSDFDKVSSLLAEGKDVFLEFNLDQKWVKGPRPQFNVVAEIKGSEKPDEAVIVSGHFDSWDGPGAFGVCDNGTGSCTALEAARILNKVKAKPKRTIRFILWTGEEQGLFGSRGYVALHANELDKISAVLVDDGGTNYQGGYDGIPTQQAIFEAAFAPVNAAFPDMPQKFTASERMPRGGGSDHAPFNAVGVPGFFTKETGRADYNFVHHTQHDKLQYAIPEYLVQSATNHAVVAYTLANLDTVLPRAPKPETTPDYSGVPGLDKLLKPNGK